MIVYFNNGIGQRRVAEDYIVQAGEIAFPDHATTDQLAAAFPNYADASALVPFLASVQIALDKSDLVLARIQEAVILGKTTAAAADVVDYINYRLSLRALKETTCVMTIPTKPPYPAGT